MAASVSPLVALIVCSARSPNRAGLQAGRFVLETLEEQLESTPLGFTPKLLDLAAWPLPLLDEPHMAASIHRSEDYAHEHTRRWSREISKYSGFIFVTPQYNWGYPANLKNAIDYLFHEWNGKAAVIISYGGRGGGKSAAQLREVLHGIRMRPTESMPALKLPEGAVQATDRGEKIQVEGPGSKWNEYRPALEKAFEELGALLKETPSTEAKK